MDLPSNPFAVLTFISAPAVLTNASCVLLFGTGNRYGRAIDRVHELAEMVFQKGESDSDEMKLRILQLESAQQRTLLIVRALTCFYTSVAAFVASTLISLVGAVLVATQSSAGVPVALSIAFFAGSIGVLAMIGGALTLAIETRFSFSVLRQETAFLRKRVHERSSEPVQTI